MIKDFDTVLSLDLIVEQNDEDDQFILDKIEERAQAKKDKDYAKADSIRNELLEQGIQLIDTKDGTEYKRV